MKKPLIALVLLTLALPFGCSTVEEEPDPLAKRGGFCTEWAKDVCSPTVVEDCNAASADDCQATQNTFCLSIVPKDYDSKHAKECLDAVTAAYKDGDLDADELGVVLSLAAPCDKLSRGTSGDGDACTGNDDCNTAADFICIMKQGATDGTCGKPEEVGGGDACDGPTQVCADGYYCNAENCVAYKKLNGACEGDYQCAPANHCVIADDGTGGTCVAREALSGPCATNDDCSSHYCAVNADPTKSKCASKIRLTLNEPLCDSLR